MPLNLKNTFTSTIDGNTYCIRNLGKWKAATCYGTALVLSCLNSEKVFFLTFTNYGNPFMDSLAKCYLGHVMNSTNWKRDFEILAIKIGENPFVVLRYNPVKRMESTFIGFSKDPNIIKNEIFPVFIEDIDPERLKKTNIYDLHWKKQLSEDPLKEPKVSLETIVNKIDDEEEMDPEMKKLLDEMNNSISIGVV